MRITTLLALALALVPVAAEAEEQPPRIDHAPVKEFTRGEPFSVRANIASPMGRKIFEPKLFVKNAGTPAYTPLPMIETRERQVFEAKVPASFTFDVVEYYLEAFDEEGLGPTRVGSARSPLSVAPKAAPPPPAVAQAPAAAVEKPARVAAGSSGAGRTAGAVITAVGVIGLGAWAGTGITVMLRRKDLPDQSAPDYSQKYSDMMDLARVVTWTAIAGCTLTVTGVVMYVVSEPASPSAVTLQLAPSSGGATAVLSGHF